MFNEEWELLTEPLLMQPLKSVCLNGIATEEDQLACERTEFWKQFKQEYPSEKIVSIDELEGNVRSKKVEIVDWNNVD